MNYFYTLEINSLSVASFTNIFSHFEGGFMVAGNAVFLDLSGSYMTVFTLLKSIHLQFMSFSMCMWRRQWHPTPVPCLENPMDGGAW